MKPTALRNLSSLAAAIAACVSSFDEIDFNGSGNKSLATKVASILRVKCDVKTQSKWRYLWNSKERLRNEVKELLTTKLKETEELESTRISDRSHEVQQIGPQNVLNEISDFHSRYNLVKIVGDGNCLFRCFSYYVYGDQKFHADTRKEIVDYVVENWRDELQMLRSTCEESMYEDEIDYERKMGSNNMYGTDFEISIFIKLYKCPIVIFRKVSEDNVIQVMDGSSSTNEVGKRSLNLIFSGQQRNGHWEVLDETHQELSQENHDNTQNMTGNIDVDLETNYGEVLSISPEKKCKRGSNKEVDKQDRFEYVTDSTDNNSSLNKDEMQSDEVSTELYSNDGEYSIENGDLQAEPAKEPMKIREQKHLKLKRIKIFTEHIGTVEIPSTHLKNALGYNDEDRVRKVIEDVMLYTLKCTCTLGFYGSVRYNSLDCVAYAKCRKPNHEQRFQFRIDKFEDPLARLVVSSNKKITIVHEKNLMAETFRVLRGPERREWQKNLRHRSVVAYLTEIQKKTNTEIKDDGHMQDLRTLHVAYKAKSEEKCKERLELKSSDLSDLMELWVQENKKKDPFLRYVSLPLTAIMYTEEDLHIINEREPTVLHLDATGSVSRKPHDLKCKKIFYYCIILKHDKELLTLAHMITSEHGIASISIFLKNYKYFVIKCGRKWPIANVITIDWSWAFIHAITQEWNLLTIRNYLNIMYDFCVNNTLPPKHITIIKTCYGHFIKRVSETIRREFQEHINNKSFLLECVSLMAICRNIKKLDEIFKHVATMLLTKSEERANDSIIALNSMIKKKTDISKILKDIEDTDENKENFDPDEEHHSENRPSADDNTIYRSSPFYRRYNSITLSLMNDMNENQSSVTNKYYAPRILECLVDRYMSYAVLWVSLDLDLVDPTISRISNAYVESAHKVMKEIVFHRTTTSSIADRVRQLNTARMDTMARIILDVRVRGTQKHHPKPKYPETASNPLIQETWMRGGHRNKRNFGHLGTRKLEDRCQEAIRKKSKIEETQPKETVRTNDALIIDNTTRDITENKNDTELHSFLGSESQEIHDQEIHHRSDIDELLNREVIHKILTTKKKEPKKRLPKFYNGVIKDIDYYMASKSSTNSIGVYKSNNTLSINEFRMTTKEYSTLRNYMWIDGVVIDCFVASSLDEWSGFSYIPTDDTRLMVGDGSGKRIATHRRICGITQNIKDNLLMPYLFEGHWRLLLANIEARKLTLMDPYESKTDSNRAIKAFKEFTHNCRAESSFRKLTTIDWEETELIQRPRQKANDGHSCGAYVMYYMECLGAKKPFDMNFKPSEYRSEVAYKLLLKSENVEDTCLNCFTSAESNSAQCSLCERRCHEQCVYKSEMKTDDEEKEIKKRSRRKKIQCAKRLGEFVCKLCRMNLDKI